MARRAWSAVSFLGSLCRAQVALPGRYDRGRPDVGSRGERALPGRPRQRRRRARSGVRRRRLRPSVRRGGTRPSIVVAAWDRPARGLDSMSQITEAARTVDVVHETDVLVVGQRPGRSVGGTRRGAGRCRHDAARPLRLLRREHDPGRRREHRLVSPRADGRGRRDRPRARGARGRDGRGEPREPVAEHGHRRRALQVRRRRARDGGRDHADAPPPRRRSRSSRAGRSGA